MFSTNRTALIKLCKLRRYHRGNQNLHIEEGQTTQ
jgi:hypothetical protein